MIKSRIVPILVYSLALGLQLAESATNTVDEPNNPIRRYDTTAQRGRGNVDRVSYIEAMIQPRHIGPREDFKPYGAIERRWKQIKEDPGDVRGHLVASQFSGPPVWYNLSPQNKRVNYNVGYQSVLTDWASSEREARKFLNQGGNRSVRWRVYMTYPGDSNRPCNYRLLVDFFKDDRKEGESIDALINKPRLRQDSTFWHCKDCGSNRHGGKPCPYPGASKNRKRGGRSGRQPRKSRWG